LQATRRLVGAGDIIAKHHKKISIGSGPPKLEGQAHEPLFRGFAVVSFNPGHYTCLENVGTMYVTVDCDRTGLPDHPCIVEVDYKTIDGTANAGSDYKTTIGTLTFEPNETHKNIGIEIVDNDIYEEDEQFSVVLSNVRATPVRQDNGKVVRLDMTDSLKSKIVPPSTATVIIVDNDHAGAFGFQDVKYKVAESAGEIVVKVRMCTQTGVLTLKKTRS
jgi:solute carrier family 8 (sodium/calcium exchanger)